MAMSNNQRSKSHRRRVATAAIPWYLAAGAIPSANCLEAVETPTQGQAYTGAAVVSGQPWTIATRFVWSSATRFRYYFGSGPANMRLGRYNKYVNHQCYTIALGVGATFQSGLVNATEYVFFVVSDGANLNGYVNNVVGTQFADSAGLEGTCRWRSAWDASCALPEDLALGATYNIALNATQRAALYAQMAP